MEKATPEVKIKIEYPAPRLSSEEEAELKKRLKSEVVDNFPELSKKGKVVVVTQIKRPPPPK